MAKVALSADNGGNLIAKRDELLKKLRHDRIPGVRGAGITHIGGSEHLLLLVAPGYAKRMPRFFEGIPVTTKETSVAKAQSEQEYCV